MIVVTVKRCGTDYEIKINAKDFFFYVFRQTLNMLMCLITNLNKTWIIIWKASEFQALTTIIINNIFLSYILACLSHDWHKELVHRLFHNYWNEIQNMYETKSCIRLVTRRICRLDVSFSLFFIFRSI